MLIFNGFKKYCSPKDKILIDINDNYYTKLIEIVSQRI